MLSLESSQAAKGGPQDGMLLQSVYTANVFIPLIFFLHILKPQISRYLVYLFFCF